MHTQSYQQHSRDGSAAAGNGRVSVVIPAYNASTYLAATLQSVFDQSLRPHEVIVVDDGSSDDTVAIARSFEGVTLISQANGGCAASRNTGTRAASGEFIAYLDADDVWAPDKLALQVAALEEYGRPAFSFTDYRTFDEHGFRKRVSELGRYAEFRKIAGAIRGRERIVIKDNGKTPVLYGTSYIAPASLMVRRADVIKAGGFDETMRLGEDHEFCLRMLSVLPAVVVMKPLLYYRQHAGQGTSKTATSVKAIHFDVARRAAAAPERYPRGDVRFLARTEFLRHYRMAMLHARLGQLNEAAHHFELSLADRWTARASVALIGARIFGSAAGRFAFMTARSLWRARPGRR